MDRTVSVPVAGAPALLDAVLDGPLTAWVPGRLLMSGPCLVRTRVRVLTIRVEVEVALGGPDVRPVEDRRRLLLLPVLSWLPEVEGVLTVERGDRRGHPSEQRSRVVFSWRVRRHGVLPDLLAELIAAAIVRAIVPPGMAMVERLAAGPR